MYGSHIYTPSQHDVGKAFGASFDSNVWPLQFFRKLTHTSELIFLERLLNLCAAVHHERAVTDDGFVKWLAVHHQELGVGLRFHCDPVASASEDGQVSFAGLFAVHLDFAAQHEKRSRVPVGQRKFRRFPGAEIHIPQIDWRESFCRAFAPAVFASDDAHRSSVLRYLHVWNLRLEQSLITSFR